MLGSDFCGVLERDGWAPYRRFAHALHQSCLAHLLRRAGELIADSIAGQARIPHALRRLLLDALAVRDAHLDLLTRRDAHAGGEVIDGTAVEITDRQLLLEAGGEDRDDREHREHREHREETIEARSDRQAHLTDEICRLERELDALLERSPTHPPNRKLLGHLTIEREHLLTFLKAPGIAATNWRAEQAIRPAVVNRKHWGGNRTWHGAGTQQVLMSVIRSARQQKLDPVALMRELLLAHAPAVASGLSIPTRACANTAEPRSARSP